MKTGNLTLDGDLYSLIPYEVRTRLGSLVETYHVNLGPQRFDGWKGGRERKKKKKTEGKEGERKG